MTTETITVVLADFADIVDVDEASWAYLNALQEDELRVKLFPYVRHEMASVKRARVRAVEAHVFGGNGDGPSAERMPVDLLANRLLLIGQTFVVSDGSRVPWLEATAAQHRDRADMQRRLAGQCLVDVERHEQAADLIEAHNVSCLDEIDS